MDNKENFGLRYIGKELFELLTEETPIEECTPRPVGGGKTFYTVTGNQVIEKLNYCFGYLWSFKIVGPPLIVMDHLGVYGELTVTFPKGSLQGVDETITITKGQAGGDKLEKFSKDGTGEAGYKAGDLISLGNTYKTACTDSLKKCASELGIYLDVLSMPPITTTAGYKPVTSQFETFYFRAKRLGMEKEEADKWAKEETGKSLDALTGNELMEAVAVLIKKEKEKKTSASSL